MKNSTKKLIAEIAKIKKLTHIHGTLYVGPHGTYFTETPFGFRLAKFEEIK